MDSTLRLFIVASYSLEAIFGSATVLMMWAVLRTRDTSNPDAARLARGVLLIMLGVSLSRVGWVPAHVARMMGQHHVALELGLPPSIILGCSVLIILGAVECCLVGVDNAGALFRHRGAWFAGAFTVLLMWGMVWWWVL